MINFQHVLTSTKALIGDSSVCVRMISIVHPYLVEMITCFGHRQNYLGVGGFGGWDCGGVDLYHTLIQIEDLEGIDRLFFPFPVHLHNVNGDSLIKFKINE